MTNERSESTWDNFGKFINQPNLKPNQNVSILSKMLK